MAHRLDFGDYAIRLVGGGFGTRGPDPDVCEQVDERFYGLMGTEDGAKLLGRARCGPQTVRGRRALEELAERLGLHYEPPAEVPARPASGRTLDIDDDHARIRALSLPRLYTRTITEFEGMCAGLIFDGVIDDAEIAGLRRWLEAKDEFLDAWPLCDVKETMDRILADGVVDDAERAELFELLDSLGASAEACGKAPPTIFDAHPDIVFEGRSFLFTGRLSFAKRKDAEAEVKRRGGRPASSVGIRLDYLVVGDLGTDAWQHSRYGRKIEAVMENKRTGVSTTIVSESDFVATLRG